MLMSIDSVHRTLREKQRQERQELILQAAEQVFDEKGYRDTSMDEIAARVGIGTATIYSHFSSKEELMVAAILERGFQRSRQYVEEINATQESATEKLREIFYFLVSGEFFRRRVQLFYALGSGCEAQKALLTSKSVIAESSGVFARTLAAIIEQGKSAGEFQQEITTATMLKAFVGLIRMQSVPDQLLNDYEGSAEELWQVYLRSIARHEA
jgi:TetR/AcrR family fatty acid metabolism transcriptional regulator